MGTERASIFGDDDDLDVSGFAPTPARPTKPADKEGIRQAAEKRGFQSREPAKEQGREAAPKPVPARQQRRHTTGRNRQLNIKATEETIERFYAIADQQNWVLGEAFEHAIGALERQVGQGG
jgi:hypothetical protein